MKKIVLGVLVLSSPYAFCQEGNLQTPMDFETTKVLPKGIRNLRYRGAMIQANDKYDSSGNQVPVGNALNKNVTWNDIINGKDTATEQGQLKGFLQNNGVNTNDEVGSTTGVANIAVDAKVPIIAYGVTSKLTSAVAIPYITSQVSTDTGSIANNSLNTIANKLQDTGSGDKAGELQIKYQNAINEKLVKYGYDPLGYDRKSHLGDVRLINKYLLVEDASFALAVRQDITFPTGEPTSTKKAVDVASGDGQWDAGAGIIGDYMFNDHFHLTAFTGYTIQMPTTMAKRIPEKQDSKLTPDIDPNTRVDLGDQFKAQTAAKFYYLNGFITNLGYTFQYREKDKYRGGSFKEERYEWMSLNTEQTMHASSLGIGYSTLPMFRQKKFPVPLEAHLTHTRVLGGKNVVNDPLTAFEFAMFF